MSARVDIPLAELTRLIQEYRGNVSAIARAKRCSRHTVQARIDESVLAGRALEDARESFVDEVEAALYANALDGNVAAQIFVMKAHPVAKRRGWGERTEVAGPDSGPIRHAVEHTRRIHDSIEHVAEVWATLAAVGAIQLSGDEPGGDAENNAIHSGSPDA